MKPKTKFITWTVALSAVLALAAARPCLADVTPNVLSLPSRDTGGQAVAVNASGQVAGQVWNETSDDPCVWTAGRPAILPVLNMNETNFITASPSELNDSGVVVGTRSPDPMSPGSPEAVRWTPNADGSYTVEGLGSIGLDGSSGALAINGQGQILCLNYSITGDTWFLWENGVRTPITNSDGTPISVGKVNTSYILGAFLSSNGRVAGTLDLGYRDQNGHEVYQAVLWQKTNAGSTVTPLTAGGSNDQVTAISPNGVVAGNSDAHGFFIYDANTAAFTYVATTPADNGSVTYAPWAIVSVNDHGRAVFRVFSFDRSTGDFLYDTIWVWQTSTWTQIPLDNLPIQLGSGYLEHWVSSFINSNGQVAGCINWYVLATSTLNQIGFASSAGAGIQQLLPTPGVNAAVVLALNDSGLAVGYAESSADQIRTRLPVTWNLLSFSWSGVLKPLNADGSSVFKAGSTVPVKFKLTGADADIPGLVATLSYAQIINGVAGKVNEAGSSVAASSGNQFRHDSGSGQYVFNWSTKGLSPGSYELIIDLGDGSQHTVNISLK